MVAPLRKEPHICRMCVNIRQKVTLSLHLHWKSPWNISKKKEGDIDFNWFDDSSSISAAACHYEYVDMWNNLKILIFACLGLLSKTALKWTLHVS